MQLYTYFRSSAAYRVRIALGLKGLPYDTTAVHLRRGDQQSDTYGAINPQHLVPVLDDSGQILTQSLAIIEYLDETRPEPPLLPRDPAGRARVRALALAIACEIHPLNNTRVLQYLKDTLGVTEAVRTQWYQHWVRQGFQAVETILAKDSATAAFCHGDAPTLADICLVPQVYNARRFDCDLSAFPILQRINGTCMSLPAFADAAPERQPDAE